MLDNCIDTAATRTLVQLAAQIGELIGIACSQHFYLAGIVIAHPAAQAELSGFAMHKPAKANALHTPADDEVKNHRKS